MKLRTATASALILAGLAFGSATAGAQPKDPTPAPTGCTLGGVENAVPFGTKVEIRVPQKDGTTKVRKATCKPDGTWDVVDTIERVQISSRAGTTLVLPGKAPQPVSPLNVAQVTPTNLPKLSVQPLTVA